MRKRDVRWQGRCTKPRSGGLLPMERSLDGRRDGMKCTGYCTYQRQRRVGRAHFVDKSYVGLDRMQTIVNIEGLATNVGSR